MFLFAPKCVFFLDFLCKLYYNDIAMTVKYSENLIVF